LLTPSESTIDAFHDVTGFMHLGDQHSDGATTAPFAESVGAGCAMLRHEGKGMERSFAPCLFPLGRSDHDAHRVCAMVRHAQNSMAQCRNAHPGLFATINPDRFLRVTGSS
jgi:hypothetical protein